MTHPRREDQAKHDPPDTPGGQPEAVRIKLLGGGFQVSVGSRTVGEDEWRLKKAAGLVKLLALEPGHRMHRERVMDLLWPELDEKAATNNLRSALYVARRALEPEATLSAGTSRYLQRQDGQLMLCPEGLLWVDVEVFEEAAGAARRTREPAAYRAALDLYAGDLLLEDRYEGWVEERREGLRRLYLALLLELAGLYEEREELGSAIEALERVVAAEAVHEEAHVSLMRLYAASGRRGEALSGKLGAEPEAVSRRLYEEIVTGRFPQAASLPSAGSPPEEPASVSRHNLPAARSSFVGREREMLEVKRLLSMTRLLTLTGAGVSGKTRLALEVAAELVGAYQDGIWMAQLAPLSDPGLAPQAVAEALGVHEQPDRPLADTLVSALRRKNLLLVVDNCEHLIDAAARLVETLLGSCLGLRILATSREALNVTGEVSWRVPSLSMPDSQHSPTVEELEEYGSARLFLERTSYRSSAFVLEPGNVEVVARICERLDGIPLAIELAAARVGTLAVEQISERLDDSLKLLTGGSRTASPRQQTLRGTLDWSHDLLSEKERKLFGRLSAFASGWILEAAEVVGAGDGTEEGDVLDLLSRLVDKSLVVAEAPHGEEGSLRYRLLEPVRQYARERLEESGEAEAARRRHALWYLKLAERAERELAGPDQPEWLNLLETEHDNLRAAIGWSLERGEAEKGLRMVSALRLFWHTRGHLSEGRTWFEKAISGSGAAAPPTLRARALKGAGWISMFQGDYEEAKSLLEEGLALFRELGEKEGVVDQWLLLRYRRRHEYANPQLPPLHQHQHHKTRIYHQGQAALPL